MDQKKIGLFLKELRKEKNITQEALAEKLNVSGRTVSRWETGSNMPDISLLVELSDFYGVSIPEIIDGERKSEKMEKEARETAVSMAEYSKNEVKSEKRRVFGLLAVIFGVFIILSAFAVFPNESSWGSIYAVIGGMFLTVGVYFRTVFAKKSSRLLCTLGCIVILFGVFTLTDYVTVTQFNQVPRFSYEKSYESSHEKRIVHKTLFFTVIQTDPDTENEKVEIVG